ncbi:AAA family ATPase [Gemmata sp. JC717]|uniref:AAA family ATPase n=1 Tax=Gemmata algarum TaxID=2975278 RepID=UPI0021BA7D89|nr:ATP-binding protein [Gemmata algarum]MDY3552385.1 AAA family ATPase [Gemmata algarum]
MIRRAKFQNFKALRDVEVTFDSRLTVLVGPNGSGKTSVLQGLETISLLARGSPPEAIADWVESTYRGYSGGGLRPLVLDATASEGQSLVRCLFRMLPSPRSAGEEGFGFSAEADQLVSSDGTSWSNRSFLPVHASPFSSTALLRLLPEVIATPSTLEAIPPRVNIEGAGVPSVLAYLDRVDRSKLAEINNILRAIIPQLESVRPDFVLTKTGVKDSIRFDFRGAKGVRPEGASSGTLIALGLITQLLAPDAPQVVLLDDLDRDLHPKAQIELIGVLRRLLDQYSEFQVIATSHSPYILDKLQPNEVRVMALRDDGSAVCARLEDHPQYPTWKSAMSPGEFWSHAGEDWVKQLNPQTAP